MKKEDIKQLLVMILLVVVPLAISLLLITFIIVLCNSFLNMKIDFFESILIYLSSLFLLITIEQLLP